MDVRQRWCAAAAAAMAVLAAAEVTLFLSYVPRPEHRLFVVGSILIGLTFGAVGLLLTGYRRGNELGPSLGFAGFTMILAFGLRTYALVSHATAPDDLWPGTRFATWFGLTFDPLIPSEVHPLGPRFFPIALIVIFLIFPGSQVSAWARGLNGVSQVAGTTLIVVHTLRPGRMVDEPFGLTSASQHWVSGSGERVLDVVGAGAVVLLSLTLLVAAVSLTRRFLSAEGIARQQYKPLVAALVVLAVGLALQVVPVLRPLGVAVFAVGAVVGLPLSIAVGSLRYRLWDLDRAAVLAITYAGLAVLVTGVYVLVVIGLVGFAGLGRPEGSLLPSVLATVAVALLFGPSREWLAQRARRLVYGDRADPYEALAALPHQLASGVDVGEVLPLTARTLVDGLGVPAARARARLRDGTVREAWSGERSGVGLVVREVVHLGEVVGDIAVVPPTDRALSAGDQRLLADLAAQAGPALRGVVLAGQLEDQLSELRDSQGRVARAAADERRRLERDIHDGAQQQLVGLAVRLSETESRLRSGESAAAAESLSEAHAQLDACIDTVRELARGIYPPVLTARGLVAAVRARTRSFPGHAEVVSSPEVEATRFGPEVELAVYFCCLEALQNAAKHAPGAAVTVTLDHGDDRLLFTVTDTGPGIDPATAPAGSGLLGMRDRIAAVGGDLTIAPGPDGGTVVHGEVPLG